MRNENATLVAARIAATAAILLSAVWCGFQSCELLYYDEVFAMVIGGKDPRPIITQWAFDYETTVSRIAFLCATTSLVYLWFTRKGISRVILAATAGTFALVLSGMFFEMGYRLPLRALADQFSPAARVQKTSR